VDHAFKVYLVAMS